MHITQKVNALKMQKPSAYYFYVKTQISVDFQICISVSLNGQISEWKPVKAGVPQGSILGPLYLLVYTNDICSNLSTNVKPFADDTSLFSIVNDTYKSFQNLSHDLCIIRNCAYQWKMSFKADRSKQAGRSYFLKRNIDSVAPCFNF